MVKSEPAVPSFDVDVSQVPLTPVKFSSKLKKFMSGASRKTALFLVRTLVFLVIRAWVVIIFSVIRKFPGIGALLGPKYDSTISAEPDPHERTIHSLGESLVLNAIDGFFKFFNRFFKLNKTIYGIVSPMIASLVMFLISLINLSKDKPNIVYDVGSPGDSRPVRIAKKSIHAILMAISLIVTNYIIGVSTKQLQQSGNLGFGRKSRSRSAAGRKSTRAAGHRRSMSHKNKKH